MWEISQHHKIHKRFKKTTILYFYTGLDLQHLNNLAGNSAQCASQYKKDSQWDQYILWNQRGGNQYKLLERTPRACNEYFCMYWQEKGTSRVWVMKHPDYFPRTSLISCICSQLKEQNYNEYNTEDETAQLNFYTGSVLIFPVWPGSAAHTYFRDCISCFEIFIFSSFNKELQFVFNLPHT